jgi:hypothetical protein
VSQRTKIFLGRKNQGQGVSRIKVQKFSYNKLTSFLPMPSFLIINHTSNMMFPPVG